MEKMLKPCPFCGKTPKIGYVCGEYFVYGEDDDCPVCGLDFGEMHSSEELEIEAWNRRVGAMNELKPCPFCGGEAAIYTTVDNSIPKTAKAFVYCKKCKASTNSVNDTKNDGTFIDCVVEAWNRRVDNGA